MMPVDSIAVLRAILLGDSEIKQLVDTEVLTHGTFTEYRVPCIVMKLTGGEVNESLDGPEESQYPTQRLEIYSNDYDQAKVLADLVWSRLWSIRQQSVVGHLVEAMTVSNAEDSDEPLLIGETLPDFLFAYNVQTWLSRAVEGG